MTEEEVAAAQETEETVATEEETDEEVGTEIRDTDIVFDCPHCGHNLAIDYRGAGLQIECVNCGESVLVPIPDGMKIDDLDHDPGEILKQLFATRRNLQKAEMRIVDLEQDLQQMTMRRDALNSLIESFAVQLEELKELGRNEMKLHEKSKKLLARLTGDLVATVGDVANGTGLADENEDASSAE